MNGKELEVWKFRSSKKAKAEAKAKLRILATKDSTTEAFDTCDHDVAEANHVAEYEDPIQDPADPEEGEALFKREASPREASQKPVAKKPLSSRKPVSRT